MKSNLKIGKLFGIQIEVKYSWFFILILITASFWTSFNTEHPDWPDQAPLIAALATSALFFLSLIGHELSHSLLAISKGLPVRSITLFLFGGVSWIEKEAMNAATEFEVAIVGPMSSFLISGIFFGLGLLVHSSSPLGVVFGWLWRLNLYLAIFNLVPGFPLDGGRVLRGVVWWATGSARKATRVAVLGGQVVAAALMALGVAMIFGVEIRGISSYWGTGPINGLWLVILGWFLASAARSTERSHAIDDLISGVHAKDLMNSSAEVIPAATTLSYLIEQQIMRTGRQCFIVADDGRFLGLITAGELKQVPRDRWPVITAGQAMKPFENMRSVAPDADLREVLEIMERDRVDNVPVVVDGALEGLVRRDDVVRFISARADFR